MFDLKDIEAYIRDKGAVDLINLQKQFSLTYPEVIKVLRAFENERIVAFCGGFEYRYIGDLDIDSISNDSAEPVNDEDDKATRERQEYLEKRRQELLERMQLELEEDNDKVEEKKAEEKKELECDDNDPLLRIALAMCIGKGYAAVSFIQRRFQVGYARAVRIMNWMEKNGYVTAGPIREIKMTPSEFFEQFGDPKELVIEEKKEEKQPDKVDTVEADYIVLRNVFSACFFNNLHVQKDEKRLVFELNDDTQFDFQFSQNYNILRISDMGKTLASMALTRRKAQAILKEFAPIGLEGDAITLTIYDLNDTFAALTKLYSAVEAIRRAK